MSDPVFSHLDAEGTARMVDVGAKPVQRRVAVAEGFVEAAASTLAALRAQALPKGDVLTVARVAAIQAAMSATTTPPVPLPSVPAPFLQTDKLTVSTPWRPPCACSFNPAAHAAC